MLATGRTIDAAQSENVQRQRVLRVQLPPRRLRLRAQPGLARRGRDAQRRVLVYPRAAVVAINACRRAVTSAGSAAQAECGAPHRCC